MQQIQCTSIFQLIVDFLMHVDELIRYQFLFEVQLVQNRQFLAIEIGLQMREKDYGDWCNPEKQANAIVAETIEK